MIDSNWAPFNLPSMYVNSDLVGRHINKDEIDKR